MNFIVTQNGKKLPKTKYAWDEKTRTFSSEENNDIPEKLTVKEVIEITKGQYRNMKLKKFFERKE